MTLPIILTTFLISSIWGLYHWYWESSPSDYEIAGRKVAFKLDSKHSASSLDSLDISDDETAQQKARRLRSETKTRWPSRTSVKKTR